MPGLDLISTKVAVDFQSITAATAAERITAGLQSMTDAAGADAIFIALADEAGRSFEKVYAGRSTFSACNPVAMRLTAASGASRSWGIGGRFCFVAVLGSEVAATR